METGKSNKERLIFHVDVNSAFLSWESARRVREGGEDLRPLRSAVGGDRARRTSVILAKSIPAKRAGVKTGEPVAAALRKCPDLILVPPDFGLYRKSSDRFVAILKEYTPLVERYSIDECFLDMTGTGRLYGDPLSLAALIKDRIRDTLGFTVNIGVSSNKVLAKMASDFEKPDKIHHLFPSEIQEKMWKLPVSDLFSVGKASADKLRRSGIDTIGKLALSERSTLEYLLGPKAGVRLHAYANGIDASGVDAVRPDAKGYSISLTTEEDVSTWAEADTILYGLADQVTARMRRDKAKATCVCVTARDASFRDRSHQKQLTGSTDETEEVIAIARRLIRDLWDGKSPLRLLGLALTDVSQDEARQLSFFEEAASEKRRKMDETLDSIAEKFGRGAIQRASSLPPEPKVK